MDRVDRPLGKKSLPNRASGIFSLNDFHVWDAHKGQNSKEKLSRRAIIGTF